MLRLEQLEIGEVLKVLHLGNDGTRVLVPECMASAPTLCHQAPWPGALHMLGNPESWRRRNVWCHGWEESLGCWIHPVPRSFLIPLPEGSPDPHGTGAVCSHLFFRTIYLWRRSSLFWIRVCLFITFTYASKCFPFPLRLAAQVKFPFFYDSSLSIWGSFHNWPECIICLGPNIPIDMVLGVLLPSSLSSGRIPVVLSPT